MGITRIVDSDKGSRCLGYGVSPYTGQSLQGRRGTIKGVTVRFGNERVVVRWDDASQDDYVCQENVSGTGMV
jgi:hypothetical protein